VFTEILVFRPLRGLGFFGLRFLGFRYAPPQALCYRPLPRAGIVLSFSTVGYGRRNDKLKYVGH